MAQIENFPVLLHALTSADAAQRVPAEELFQNAKAATPQELIGALLAAIGQMYLHCDEAIATPVLHTQATATAPEGSGECAAAALPAASRATAVGAAERRGTEQRACCVTGATASRTECCIAAQTSRHRRRAGCSAAGRWRRVHGAADCSKLCVIADTQWHCTDVSQAAWPEVVPFTFGALMSELPEEREAGLWLFACLGDYMAASAGGCKASADAVAVALQRCLMDESSIGVRLAAAGALLAVLAGCGGEDERSAFSGCLPHVLSAVEATAAAAAHAVAAAAHSTNSSAASAAVAVLRNSDSHTGNKDGMVVVVLPSSCTPLKHYTTLLLAALLTSSSCVETADATHCSSSCSTVSLRTRITPAKALALDFLAVGFTEGTAAASALASASRQLCELLEVLVELAALCPGFFRPRLQAAVSGMSLLASNTATPLSARQLALEFLVTLAEEAPAMCRYVLQVEAVIISSAGSIPHTVLLQYGTVVHVSVHVHTHALAQHICACSTRVCTLPDRSKFMCSARVCKWHDRSIWHHCVQYAKHAIHVTASSTVC
eukprot:15984-Heterococcus_DN1.PRE.3